MIPALVHFFARSRPPAYAFSDIAFLQTVLKKTSRLKKPQDWLSLLLRTLAIAALLFAFLHPLLISKSGSGQTSDEKTIIFIIDQSASMAAQDGGSSRFSKACDEANKLIDTLEPDKANIIWMKARAEAAFPSPGPNLTYLKEQLQQAETKSENATISTSIKLAINQLESVNGEKEIILISDFQQSAWKDASIALPDSITLTKLKVGDRILPNLAITSLTSMPLSPVIGQTCTLTGRVQNFSDQAKRTTVYLNVAGSRQSKELDIPAWGTAEVAFTQKPNKSGPLPVTLSLSEDTFSEDDSRHTLVEVRPTLRLVSLAQKENPVTEIFDRAATALEWLEHRTLQTLPQTNSCDILFLHEWDGSQIEKLTTLSAATTVIAQPGLTCPSINTARFLNLPPHNSRIEHSSNPQGWKVKIAAESSPLFRLFRSGEFGNPAEGAFRKRLELPALWSSVSGITTLLAYEDSIPALLSSKVENTSRVLWNIPVDPEKSDWVQHEPFLPFLAELFLHIKPDNNQLAQESFPGSPATWLASDQFETTTIKLVDLTDNEWELSVNNTTEGTLLSSSSDIQPGIYRWMAANSTVHTSYANFPSSESDLRQLDPSDLGDSLADDSDALIRANALANGIALWPWLIAASLAFLLAESLASTPLKAKLSTPN